MMSSGLISGPGRHWPCSSQISTVLLRQFSPPPITCGTFSGWVHDWVVREPVTFHLQPPTHGSTPEKKKKKQGRHPELTAHSGSRSIFTSTSSQNPKSFTRHTDLTKFPKSKKKRWRTLKPTRTKPHFFQRQATRLLHVRKWHKAISTP